MAGMDFIEPPEQASAKGLTLTVSRPVRNGAIAKVLILIAFTLLVGHFYAKEAAQDYAQGLERMVIQGTQVSYVRSPKRLPRI